MAFHPRTRTTIRWLMGSHCQINQVSPPMNGGSQRLTYEELHIILYSRLLLPIHKHSDDGVHCLSPGHFLVGCSLQTLPDYDHDHNDTKLPLLNRWSLCQALSQHFWCKRSREYLQQLQKLRKWRSPSRNVLPGDIVLIKSRLHLLAYGQVRADVPGKRWKDSSGYHPDSVRTLPSTYHQTSHAAVPRGFERRVVLWRAG